ncbi:MAG: aminoacyl-histidine dipeptidase [Methanosarcinaceae archaeon]|nr:aminoacyl-histidine dipeptidase [Methanosarcinaceae archaeon]
MISINIILNYFYEISQIPRPSGKEDKIRDYLIDFACSNKLEWKSDSVGNVFIKKNAAKGFEKSPTVVLQSHMDIVCEKEKGYDFDFEKQPIRYDIDGDFIKSYKSKTTLGADNGVGMAISLAILSSDIKCGPIECIFTVDEEMGFTGVHEMKPDFFSGNLFINLDWEKEGEICIGCAGGIKIDSEKAFEPKSFDIKNNDIKSNGIKNNEKLFRFEVSGLKSGHSGGEIHLNRENAIKIVANFMDRFESLNICEINVGNLPNVIPGYGYVIFGIENTDNVEKIVEAKFTEFEKYINESVRPREPNIKISIENITSENISIENITSKNISIEKADVKKFKFLSQKDSKDIISVLNRCPTGVISYDPINPDFVETSNNIASVKTEEKDGKIVIKTTGFLRSSSNKKKYENAQSIKKIFDNFCFKTEFHGDYSAWEPDYESDFTKYVKSIYEKSYNKKIEVVVTHAGLECGAFKLLRPEIKAVSIGPDICGAHTPSEKFSISSLKRFSELLVGLIISIQK